MVKTDLSIETNSFTLMNEIELGWSLYQAFNSVIVGAWDQLLESKTSEIILTPLDSASKCSL